MARRSIVSYSDLTSGPSLSVRSGSQTSSLTDEGRAPRHRKHNDGSSWNDQAHPSKKRKKGNRGGNPSQPASSSQNFSTQPTGGNRHTQHWDHVASSREDSGGMPYDDAGDQSFASTPHVAGKTALAAKKEGGAVTVVSDSPKNGISGPLAKADKSPVAGGLAGPMIGQPSLAEIWDDSALIDAWEAANEEYKVMHGEEKAWKTEPEPSSALWHNVSVAKRKMGLEPQPVAATDVPEPDGMPSLAAVAMPRTKEEVFQKAAEAWYWAGYWSGVYRTMESTPAWKGVEAESEEEEEEEEDNNSSDQFLATQR